MLSHVILVREQDVNTCIYYLCGHIYMYSGKTRQRGEMYTEAGCEWGHEGGRGGGGH